jgi:phasin family protein
VATAKPARKTVAKTAPVDAVAEVEPVTAATKARAVRKALVAKAPVAKGPVLKAVPAPELVEAAPAAAKPVKAAKPTVAGPRVATKVANTISPAAIAAPAPSVPKDFSMTSQTPAKTFEAIAPAMEKATAEMTAKVKDMMEKNMKSMTDMTEFAKGNVEAMIESAKAAAAGAETLTSHMVETSKKSVEEAQAAFKAMTSAKTPNEMIAAQNEFAKAQFDKAVANMSHFSETWMKLAGDVVQPISSRMAVAAETVKKSIAA